MTSPESREPVKPLPLFQIAPCIAHQTLPLGLRGSRAEHFRMLGLGHAQVEVAPQLLYIRIIVGMDHLRPGLIGNPVPCPDRRGRVYHVLIEDRMPDETAQFFVDISPVSRAYIGAEKSLDAHTLQIRRRLHPGRRRVVEIPGSLLELRGVRARQLSGIGRRHVPLQICRQALHQKGIHRQGVLGHGHEDFRLRISHRPVPGPSMVELPLFQMPHLYIGVSPGKSGLSHALCPLQQFVKICLPGIHEQNSVDGHGLALQLVQQGEQLPARSVYGNDDVDFQTAPRSFPSLRL